MQRGKPLRRTSGLKPRSSKRARLYARDRVPLVAELLAGNPPCQRCKRAPAVDVHELKSRARGGSILDRDNLVVVCRPCHTWITTHPAQALDDGWLRNSWDQP